MNDVLEIMNDLLDIVSGNDYIVNDVPEIMNDLSEPRAGSRGRVTDVVLAVDA
jgi:hypothetical protein